MVSGYGAAGGRGRCYTFWQDFFKCVETNGVAKSSEACWREWADYLECLHQRKMMQRIRNVRKEKERLIKEGKWDDQ